MERLAFCKCYFCNKNFNKLQLIDMSKNTVMINDEDLRYIDLIFDVCLFEVCLPF
jgi:hypothetical protein